jgi:hypothetical protein
MYLLGKTFCKLGTESCDILKNLNVRVTVYVTFTKHNVSPTNIYYFTQNNLKFYIREEGVTLIR